MRLGAKKRSIWVEAGVVALLIALAVTAFVRNETRPLKQADIKIAAANLRSLSSDAGQLVKQFLDGQVTETFFRSQASLMRDNAKSAAKQMESSRADGDLELKRWQTGRLGEQLEANLKGLADGTSDPTTVRVELKKLFGELKKMEDGLKQQ
jgi:hypothetical protein